MMSIINSRTKTGQRLRICFTIILVTAQAGGSVLAQSGKTGGPSLEDKHNPELIGRRNINKGNMSFYSIDREVSIGRQLAMEIDKSSKMVNDPLVNEFVNRIGQNIVLHSDSKVPFTIKVIDSPEINAFALPGGFLYVNRGLLEAAENEAEVAGVLAHEIAHVAARHGIEQASKGELLNYATLPLIFLGGWGGYLIQQVAGVAVPLTLLKFSRNAESEADWLGAQYMWATGYDPNALITFFEKLQSHQGKNALKSGGIAKIFSTHPMTSDRITNVRKLIIKFPDRGEYQLNSSDYAGIRARLTGATPATIDDGQRPVLRRRPREAQQGEERQSTTDQDYPVSSSSDRTSTEGDSTGSTDRPILKRRKNAESGQSNEEPKKSEVTGRPTLRRRPVTW